MEAKSNSLKDRMAARAESLAQRTSEKFPLPGYEDLLLVELSALGFTRIQKIVARNERERDEAIRNLYIVADQLLAATVGFHEIQGDTSVPLDNTGWVEVAHWIPDCPETLTPRQALLHVLGDKRIHHLLQEWEMWTRAVKPENDSEVVRDFVATG